MDLAAPIDLTRSRAWFLALPAISCSAVLGLFQLGQPSIWVDEAFTARWIERDYDRLLNELQWGHFMMVKAWSAIAGTSEAALRFPSVVGAVVAVALLFGLARRMYGERVALVASLLLAVNPFVVKWSQQARGYTILLAIAIGATWLLLRARELNTFTAWAEYGLSIVLLIHWHPLSALLLIAVHVVVAGWSRWALATWAAAAVLSLPWLERFRDGTDTGLPTDWIPTPGPAYFGRLARDFPGALGVGLALALVGVFLISEHRRLVLAWAGLPLALLLSVSLADPVIVDRYLIISCPAFALLSGVALVELSGHVRSMAAVAAAVGTAIGLVLWYAPDGGNNWRGQNWRAATTFVMNHGGGEVRPSWAAIAYEYYGGRAARTGWVIQVRPDGKKFNESDIRFGSRLRVLVP